MMERQQLAQMLQGVGAGLQGRGLEYRQQQMAQQQAQQQQRQALDEKRRQALLIDNRIALNHLKNGNVDAAKRLAEDRIRNIERLGGDPVDTKGIYELLNNGQVDEAVSQMDELDQQATLAGLLPEPEKPDMTSVQKDARALGLQPGTPEYKDFIMQNYTTPRNQTNVNINQGDVASDAATKKYGAGVGDLAVERRKKANEAVNQNAQLDVIQDALDQGADTGLGEGLLTDMRSFANTAFGLDLPENIGQQELIRSMQSQMALRIRSPESGMGLPGATSNRDIKFLMDIVPGLTKTEEGNKSVIEAFRRLNNMKIRVAKKQDQIIQENNGRVPFDLEQQLADFVEKQNVLTEDEKDALRDAAKGGKKQTESKVIDFGDLQ